MKYIKPIVDVIVFENQDIITDSSGIEANQNGLLPDINNIFDNPVEP